MRTGEAMVRERKRERESTLSHSMVPDSNNSAFPVFKERPVPF
jgi:hypothetical protein